ncbi:snRNA-activating protein complex subunit 2 isoform X2 [Pseudorasbora parva]|uniref:snRNA-activating protein complex subunit 2 isoform X2 n=1 Tax=Pseudorasbora parva TaxID=51549 RepID=UPI00351DBA81
MKPPFRKRTEPSRFLPKAIEKQQKVSDNSFCQGWDRKDLQNFLQALKQQQNFESELDLTEIQKKVPQRSLKEIEDLIKSLKSCMLQKVYLQVHSQRRECRKAKVPIEIWAELVQKISKSHEKTISSAFSQILVIAATEPCGLMHSEPPHPTIKTPAFSSLHPAQSPKPPSRPSATGMSPNPSVFSTSAASIIQPDSSSNAVDHISEFESASSSSHLMPNTPEAPASSQMARNPSHLQSEAEPTVSSPVSPESAVLLDMLMCLPEELPLLDCKELQHHFLQLHSQLSKTAIMAASNVPNAADSTAITQKLRTTTGSSEESSSTEPAKDKDWATAGTCPLNPLLVPVTMLKRLSLDSEK